MSFEGKYYSFTDVALLPRPVQQPHPPIWIGGRSDAALARVARFGDGWLAYMVTAQRFKENMTKIAELARREGRNPETIGGGLLLFAYVGKSREETRRMAVADLSARYNQPFEKLVDRYCAVGTPAECAETIASFLAAGAVNLALKFTCPPEEQLDQQAAFAQSVRPLLPR